MGTPCPGSFGGNLWLVNQCSELQGLSKEQEVGECLLEQPAARLIKRARGWGVLTRAASSKAYQKSKRLGSAY